MFQKVFYSFQAAFDRFHHDQIKALNNNSGHVNGQLSYLDEIPAQAVDEAFEASIARFISSKINVI